MAEQKRQKGGRRSGKTGSFCAYVAENRYLYLLLLPAVVYYFIFCYLPMGGVLISFQDFMPALGLV